MIAEAPYSGKCEIGIKSIINFKCLHLLYVRFR